MIITHKDYVGTDELCVEFYRCRLCGFSRIPKQQDSDYAREHSERGDTTAKFCPGCAIELEWEVLSQ